MSLKLRVHDAPKDLDCEKIVNIQSTNMLLDHAPVVPKRVRM